LSLRSKPLEILLDLTAFRTCCTPLATNRGSLDSLATITAKLLDGGVLAFSAGHGDSPLR
jgi:hypothetical protein